MGIGNYRIVTEVDGIGRHGSGGGQGRGGIMIL